MSEVRLVLLVVVLALAPGARAQHAKPPPQPYVTDDAARRGFWGELLFSGALAFSADPSFGVGIGYATGFAQLPISLGADLIAAWGPRERSSGSIEAFGRALPYYKQQQDQRLLVSLRLRVQPTYKFLRPYVEGFVGGKRLQTEYSVYFPGSATSADARTSHEWARNLGWGAGLDLLGILNTGGSLSLSLGYRRAYAGPLGWSRTVAVDGGETVVVHERRPSIDDIFLVSFFGRFDLGRAYGVNE